jgi:hypothetical protein
VHETIDREGVRESRCHIPRQRERSRKRVLTGPANEAGQASCAAQEAILRNR